jgi:hypothetical protein
VLVIAGLDPAIHPHAKKMDARIKSAHDASALVPVVRQDRQRMELDPFLMQRFGVVR